jgi:hypothetical protein
MIVSHLGAAGRLVGMVDRPAPPDTVSFADFRAADERRTHSHVLSFGSAWKVPGWTDDDHVVEIFWYGATHEIVANFITYDWGRLGPGRLNRDSVAAEGFELVADSGSGVGRVLGDYDLATSDIHVRVLGHVHSGLQCHELLWDWRWMQHHPDGFEHVSARIRDHVAE